LSCHVEDGFEGIINAKILVTAHFEPSSELRKADSCVQYRKHMERALEVPYKSFRHGTHVADRKTPPVYPRRVASDQLSACESLSLCTNVVGEKG
jgi:hypothetical protein